ncbi:hypothetical protein GCM10015536_64230 [Streptomyces griseomycini]|nr:hypothetical protein GCM10015536_64230 [Streptomyces griseomycini]
MAVDNRTHSLGADASTPVMYMVGRPCGGLRAACRQRLSDARKRVFTARSKVGSTRFAPAAAAIIIRDAGPAPQTALPERTQGRIRDLADRPARSA